MHPFVTDTQARLHRETLLADADQRRRFGVPHRSSLRARIGIVLVTIGSALEDAESTGVGTVPCAPRPAH